MTKRVWTAAVGIPIVLALTFLTWSWPLAVTIVGVAFVAGYELTRLYTGRPGGFSPPSFTLALAGFALAFITEPNLPAFVLIGLWPLYLVGVFGAWRIAQGDRVLLYRAFASFWIICPLLACVALHRHDALDARGLFAPNALLIVFVTQWAGDTAAILAGMKFGRRPLAPKISPNKTVEGATANLLVCMMVAAVLASALGIPVWKGLVAGALCGVLGQMGDLLESSIKRSSGCKDSGRLLPGHGGMLDRIDSLLFSALPMATVLVWL